MNNLSRNSDEKQPVFRADGKAVGYISGDTLYKAAIAGSHMMRKPPGWAWDTCIIDQAVRQGVTLVKIYDGETRITYLARIQEFYDYGIYLNRGYGEQICLPLKYWQIIRPGEMPAQQLALAI